MFKRIFSIIFSFILSICSCNGILMELLHGDFSFIINDETLKASVSHIYIGTKEVKDIFIPSKVEFSNKEYTVNSIHDCAIEGVIGRIRSIEIPKTLDRTNENLKSLKLLFINNIPVKYSE